MARKAQPSQLTKAMLKTADDIRVAGILDEPAHEKITLRHLGAKTIAIAAPITGEEIRSMRERANLSQAVFARYLNLTTGYVCNWSAA